jgi:hypothetical protein
MENGSGLDSFRGILDQYRGLILVAIGAVPLAPALACLNLAWPSGITGVTAVAQPLERIPVMFEHSWMLKEVAAFPWAETTDNAADPGQKGRNGALVAPRKCALNLLNARSI